MPDLENDLEQQEEEGQVIDAEEATAFTLYGDRLFGRKEILTGVDSIHKGNLIRELSNALAIHHKNAGEIDYLYKYMRGRQPILGRTKKVRPEICNRVISSLVSSRSPRRT